MNNAVLKASTLMNKTLELGVNPEGVVEVTGALLTMVCGSLPFSLDAGDKSKRERAIMLLDMLNERSKMSLASMSDEDYEGVCLGGSFKLAQETVEEVNNESA